MNEASKKNMGHITEDEASKLLAADRYIQLNGSAEENDGLIWFGDERGGKYYMEGLPGIQHKKQVTQ